MEIPRKDQIKFAKELIAIAENTTDAKTLSHLKEMTSLLVSWVGKDNGVAVNLSEYIGELAAIANGQQDDGWKDEFKKILYSDLG